MIPKADKIWMDGEFVGWDEANVHILTHTLHYGLGAFEGIRAYRRADGRTQIFRLHDHIVRLNDSARIAGVEMPFSVEEIEEACRETLRVNAQSEAYLRPLVYLGYGVMGIYARQCPVKVAIASWKWGTYLGDGALEAGVRAKISSWNRNHPNSMMPKGKISGHYVNSIMAKHEAKDAGYDEAIMLDHQGMISEASGANFFIVKDGVLKTPSYSSSILGGITRDSILTLAKDMGVEVAYGSFSRDELYLADEAFFVGTAAEVTPVRSVDERTIGRGGMGELTRALQTAYFDIVKGSCEKYTDWLDFV